MENARFADMISKVAHELRSPLTSLKGFSATMLARWDRFSDQQRYELIETIHADAERMGRIISEVLDLARIESGRLELHRLSVAVGDILERSVANVQTDSAERVKVSAPGDLSALLDAERMEHVFTNLIENAVKFSDDMVAVTASVDGEGAIEVTVADRGVGIPSDRLPYVFSGPGPVGQSATPSGSGLGLYLSSRLVEAHGGALTVVSEEGEGSTFTVSLPAGGSR